MPTLLERANETLRKRKKVITDARAILEKDEVTDEDRTTYDQMLDDAETLREDAERLKRQHETEAALEDVHEPAVPPDPDDRGDGGGEDRPWEYRTGYGRAVGLDPTARENQRIYRVNPVDDPAAFRRTQAEYVQTYRSLLGATTRPEEHRALSAGIDTEGGYTRPPEQFVADLIKAVDDAVLIRPLATVYQVPKAESMGRPSLENDPDDADWTSELATGSEDSTMDFGKRELYPHPLAKRLKVSKKLIRASAMNIDQLVRQRLAYKFGITQEKAFMTGAGADGPLGVFTASDDGISTSRDKSTGNTTTEIQFDGLKEAKYAIKGAYWPRLRWIFHRDAVKQIDKLKDGDGQYIWQPSTQAGKPDMLLGFGVLMSEYAPSTFTTGQYVGILGDFSHYWIAEALDMTIEVLTELYAEANRNGYIGRMEVDGMPVLEEAFARVTLA